MSEEHKIFNPLMFDQREPIKDNIFLDKVLASMFDVNKHIAKCNAVIYREGIETLTKQNFSIVSGIEGSRKTWFCLSIASAFFNRFLGFDNAIDGSLLWFDTEQADEDIKNVTDRFFRITELPKNTSKVRFFALREYTPKERVQIIEGAIEYFKPDLVILDGGADLLLKGVNDEQDSNYAVYDLMRWTKIYDCHIINVVHNTHGNEKARGHYGSAALRKSETAYVLTSEGNITNVKHVKTRKKKPEDFCFCIDPVTILPELTTVPITGNKKIKLENAFNEILHPSKSLNYTELINNMIQLKEVSESTAKRYIKSAISEGIIKNTNGNYSIIINHRNNGESILL